VKISFPGSRRDVYNIGLEGLGMPERAKGLLREWHDPLDARPYDEEEEDFDQAASDARGLAAAKEVKLFLGERIYLGFRPLQEIVITRGGRAEEAGVPEFILKLAEGR
jgi:hypothetical protein